VVFALLVPLLGALLEGDTATAGRWLLALAAAVAVTGVVYYLQAMASFGIGLHLQKTMQTRIANPRGHAAARVVHRRPRRPDRRADRAWHQHRRGRAGAPAPRGGGRVPHPGRP
jgi:hypothetical protein